MNWLKELIVALVLILIVVGQSRAGLRTKLNSRKKSDDQKLIEVFSSKLKCPPETGSQFLTCAMDLFANASDEDEKDKYEAAVCRFLDDINSCYAFGFANCVSPEVPEKQKGVRKEFQNTFKKVDCSQSRGQITMSNSNSKHKDDNATDQITIRSDGGAGNHEEAHGNNNETSLGIIETSTLNSNETLPDDSNSTTTSNLGSTSGSEIIRMRTAPVFYGIVETSLIFLWFKLVIVR